MQLLVILGDDWNNVYLRMGGLHTKTNYQATVGDYLQDSELPLIWAEAGLVSEGEAEKILNGGDYEAAMQIHKITSQAAWRKVMPQFLNYLKEYHTDMHTDILSLSKDRAPTPLLRCIDSNEFFDVLDTYLEERKKDKTFKYFWNYMEMVQKMLTFTRGERTEDFALFINAFKRMLDDFTQ